LQGEKIQKVINSLSQLSSGRILDIATGTGDFISFFKSYIKSYSKIIGIDHSEKSLEIARTNIKDDNIEFIKMNAYNTNFKKNYFDIITISNSLHHFIDPKKILDESIRTLKKDGKVIINEMISDNLDLAQISHRKLHHFSAKIDMMNNVFHLETYIKKELINLISKKLNIIEIISYTYPLKENTQVINKMYKSLESILKKAEKFNRYKELKNEAEEIKNYIKKYGFKIATSLYIVGEKKGV